MHTFNFEIFKITTENYQDISNRTIKRMNA
jgi:hypothetical protein